MQITEQAFVKLHEDHSQVANHSTNLAIQTNEAFAQATKDFSEVVEAIKKAHKKELSQRDCVIKTLVIVILAITTCALGLGTKIIINKC